MVVSESVPRAGSAAEPRTRSGWSALLSAVLLVILVAGAANALASIRPQARPESDLTGDLAAGRVTYVDYDRGDHRVRWAVGPWRWKSTIPTSWIGARPDLGGDPVLTTLRQQAGASGHAVPVRVRERSGWWPAELVWGPYQSVAAGAWLLALVLMLARRDHRYATRWAWFWLFTVGQAGALLYLLLEPLPLWWRRARPLRRGTAAVRGGSGFVWALILSIGASVVAAAFAA